MLLREEPEESEKINKILEKLQQLENSCAEVTNGYKKISAHCKKISAVIHNYEDAKMVDSNNGDKRENEVTDDKKVLKKIPKQGEGYE